MQPDYGFARLKLQQLAGVRAELYADFANLVVTQRKVFHVLGFEMANVAVLAAHR